MNIKQFIFDTITGYAPLAEDLSDGSGGYNLFPGAVPRGIDPDKVITYSIIGTTDVYPALVSFDVQFSIFARTDTEAQAIAKLLGEVYNDSKNRVSGENAVLYSIRRSQSDLPYDYNNKTYQIEATYYFKLP